MWLSLWLWLCAAHEQPRKNTQRVLLGPKGSRVRHPSKGPSAAGHKQPAVPVARAELPPVRDQGYSWEKHFTFYGKYTAEFTAEMQMGELRGEQAPQWPRSFDRRGPTHSALSAPSLFYRGARGR